LPAGGGLPYEKSKQATTTSNNNKQKGSVCRFSGWPTADGGLLLDTRIDKGVVNFQTTTHRSETGLYPSDLDEDRF
jgi:hypothetical protein